MQAASFSFHNNEKYWKNADKFQPERFMTEKGTSMAAFCAFGDVSLLLAQLFWCGDTSSC